MHTSYDFLTSKFFATIVSLLTSVPNTIMSPRHLRSCGDLFRGPPEGVGQIRWRLCGELRLRGWRSRMTLVDPVHGLKHRRSQLGSQNIRSHITVNETSADGILQNCQCPIRDVGQLLRGRHGVCG